MAKSKSSSELEYLRGVVRKQEAQIRDLKKKLSKANPTLTLKEEKPKEKMHTVKRTDGCPSCGEPLQKIHLGIRKMLVCEDSDCSYQKIVKTKD